MSQTGTENDKYPKFLYLKTFYAISVKRLTDYVDWSVENIHQGKKSLSSSLSWGDICNFLNEKRPKLTPKTTKNKLFEFSKFL